jgi:hypothetical protein
VLNVRVPSHPFPESKRGGSDRHAETLRGAILDAAPNAKVERRKESQETMDFGATLGILLAAPAVVAIAKGLQIWLERHHGVELEIVTPDGTVIAKNITAANVVDVINAANVSLR